MDETDAQSQYAPKVGARFGDALASRVFVSTDKDGTVHVHSMTRDAAWCQAAIGVAFLILWVGGGLWLYLPVPFVGSTDVLFAFALAVMTLFFLGIFAYVVRLSFVDARRPDLMRFRTDSDQVEFPRMGLLVERRSIRRVVLAKFWTGTPTRRYYGKHVVLEVDASITGQRWLPLADLSGLQSCDGATKLSQALDVPLDEVRLGRVEG